MPRKDAVTLAAARDASGGAASSIAPPEIEQATALARLAALQSLLWKEDAVKARERATTVRLESATRDIAGLTTEIIGLRDACTTALRTTSPLTVPRKGAGSRPLGYQHEQLYRKLFLSVQGDPRALARALCRWQRDLAAAPLELELGRDDAAERERERVANFLVYHLFPRCDRSSHADAAGVLQLIDELHAVATEEAEGVAELWGRDTLLCHVWAAYFRRIARPYLSQALREMIVNIAAMPEQVNRTPAKQTPQAPPPAIELEQNASATKAMQDSPVGKFLIPSTPGRTPQTSARKSMTAAWNSMTEGMGTPVTGGGAPQTPGPPPNPSGPTSYPPMPLDALLAFGKKIIGCIVDNVGTVPKELRWVVRSAWGHASAKFGGEASEAQGGEMHQAMSALLFWSLLSEALVFPELSGSMEPLEVAPPTRAKLQQIECVLCAAFTGEDFDVLVESSGIALDVAGGAEESDMFRSKLQATDRDRFTYVDRLIAAPSPGDELATMAVLGSASAIPDAAGVAMSTDATELEWPIAAYPNDLFTMHRALDAHCGEGSDGADESAAQIFGELLIEMGKVPENLPPQRNNLFAMLPRFASAAEEKAGAVSKRYKQLPAEDATQEEKTMASRRMHTKKKLRAVVTRLPKSALVGRVTSGSAGGGDNGTPLLDVILQQRGEVLNSTGGRVRANSLYEVFLSLDDLPAADKENNFLPFIEEICGESQEVIDAYSTYGLDSEGAGASGVGEEYIFHLRQETATLEHQKDELGEHIAQLLVRKVIMQGDHARPIQNAVKDWLRAPCPDCGGDPDINEDAFLCKACCTHMSGINDMVTTFLQRFDGELAVMQPTVGLRLADWAIARAHESLFPLCDENGAFERHMQSLQFITPDFGTFYEYLMEGSGMGGGSGAAPALLVHENSLMLVMEELLRINGRRGPNRKLECIAEFWRGTIELLSLTQGAPAADDYVPLLSYITLKASPRNLLSNLQYVYTFATGRYSNPAYERALVDFGQAVKVLQRLLPQRMSPETPLTAAQGRLKESALAMDFTEEDILLALRHVPTEESMDEERFKRSKLLVRNHERASE